MRSILSNFPTEKVELIKRDLSVIDSVEALVDGKMIFIDESARSI